MSEFAVWNTSQLVTLAGPERPAAPRVGAEMRELAIIPQGAMLVRNGRIQATGSRAEIERAGFRGNASPETAIVDAGGRVVLPGFVDAHTHPVFAGTRADEYELRAEGATYAEIAARGGGIRSTVRRTRAATEDELAQAARRYREWFLRGGTTTVEAKSGYGLSLEAECKILRVIHQLGQEGSVRYVPTFLGAHEVPDEYRGRMDDYIAILIHEMLPRIAEEHLAEYCDVFCEPSVFPAAKARTILAAAKALGFGLRLHADQFSADEGALLAAEMGAATADHLECHRDRGPGGAARGGSAARAAAGFGLQPRLDALPRGAADDRGGVAGGVGHGFQSWVFSHHFHAVGAVAGLHSDEDDAGRGHHRGHRQCRAQFAPGPRDRLAGTG